jgi:glyoxylase-like metal-dependent hydrolase (beta-lactamase superfamily II)
MDTMIGLTAPDIERWSERVVVVRGLNPSPFAGPGTNTFLVGTGSRPLLVDTGSRHEGYVPLLERALAEHCRTDAPGDVLVTHAHPDHLPGAVDVIARFGERAVRKLPWPEQDARVSVSISAVRDGDIFRTDGATLHAVHTPGHAPDHLCFYLEEERALFTGDNVLGVGTTVISTWGGDMAAYIASLERLLELDIERIYPGHGPLIPDGKERLQQYLAHRLERERQVIDALRAGASDAVQIVERVYLGLPAVLRAAAADSVTSHLIKLEREGRAARLADAKEARWRITE